jgi:hypothetical protein
MLKSSSGGFPCRTNEATVSTAINAGKENQPLLSNSILSVNGTKDNHIIFENEAIAEKSKSKR